MRISLPITTVHLKNFKAIRDSKPIVLTPITIFIGNNGSGKSSVIEGLETFHQVILNGLDHALTQWHGFEYIWNQVLRRPSRSPDSVVPDGMEFTVAGTRESQKQRYHVAIQAVTEQIDEIRITRYRWATSKQAWTQGPKFINAGQITDDRVKKFVKGWQFLHLEPRSMMEPTLQRRAAQQIGLERNGSNLAEYLHAIRMLDLAAFNEIVEALKVVLPYVNDLTTNITSELERRVYLALNETNVKTPLPGWLLSSGTVRILAILAVLRHPQPPPVIIIEELENGIDPRTLQFLVEEFRLFTEAGKGQIIITSHSPYLLDLFSLTQIVVVERDESGAPTFFRPAKQSTLDSWTEKFAPGRLYTMGVLTRN